MQARTVDDIILASTSPRRLELLTQAGIRCDVHPPSIDETPFKDETPADYVKRLAREKARSVVAVVRPTGENRPVLGADTVVELDGRLMGKPSDGTDAQDMLRELSGRVHRVFSAVMVECDGQESVAGSVTEVHFRVIPAQEIEAYVASGDAYDKAGAYAIQGRGASFVHRLEGSYTGVVGLPMAETVMLLRRCVR